MILSMSLPEGSRTCAPSLQLKGEKMKRSIQAIIGVLIMGVALLIAPVAANAAPTGCATGWIGWYNGGTNWGQMRFCYAIDMSDGTIYWNFQVDDTLTDGYAVHLEACYATQCGAPTFVPPPFYYDELNGSNPTWPGCVQSTGPVVTSVWPGLHTPWQYGSWPPGSSYMNIRVVKGRCDPGGVDHQDVTSFVVHLSD
jgi:hypothetical protein